MADDYLETLKKALGGSMGHTQSFHTGGGLGPEPPRVRPPPDRAWRLVLWDGLDRSFEVSFKGLQVGLSRDGETIPAAAGGTVAQEVLGIQLAGTLIDHPRDLASQLKKLTGRIWTEAEVTSRASKAAMPPQHEDALVKTIGPRIDGPWQIVVGADVRVVRHGHCPATHLPAYSCQSKDRAERLVGWSTALGYDGSTRIAPELCVTLTLDGLEAYSDRLAALDVGMDPSTLPDPERLLAMYREQALKEARSADGRARMIDRGVEPPDLEPESLEVQIAAARCEWTVLANEHYLAWASGRGLVNPVRLDERVFPGCERALYYGEGYTALFYADHVKVGRPTLTGL